MKHLNLHYQIFGNTPISIVVEIGLGACLAEWIPMAKMLQDQYGILLYERAGIGQSEPSPSERTPHNIAQELHGLLNDVEHTEQVVIIAHSQGGLYAMQFCEMFPDMVKGVLLLDPLSPRDLEFKTQLSKKEYQKSGVDKSANFKIMRVLAKLGLGGLSKQMLKKAPPLYYYEGYSDDETEDILGVTSNSVHMTTALEEYQKSHEEENLTELNNRKSVLHIPLILITHASSLAIEESMKFGSNSEEFAGKIETMWQDIMKEYLKYSDNSRWIQAQKSTHYIHLQEPGLIIESLKELN